MTDKMNDLRIGCFNRTRCLITRDIDEELDKKIEPHRVTVSFKVPTEAPPLDLNVQEGVVGTSTTADSGMDQYIEQDNNEIGDETNDDILLEGEEEIIDVKEK